MSAGHCVIPSALPNKAAAAGWTATSVPMAVKRIADLAISAPLLVLFLPLFAVVAALIKIESRGPILFRQPRHGRGFRPFVMIKFRTMRVGIPDPRPNYETLADDPRITRVGKFLRNTSIDELPQLINVIAGTMSLVGPRPLVEWESQAALATHAERFEMPPGITGLSQLAVRNGANFSERLDKDVEYCRRWGLVLDAVILAKTPWRVLWGANVYPPAQPKAADL